LLEIHRWSALALLVASLSAFYRAVIVKAGALGVLAHGKVTLEWARRHHPHWHRHATRSRKSE
jgi:cytochrome b subunit of formate dehydrogenase